MALFSTIWRYLKRPLYKIFFTAPITFGRRRGVEIDAVLLTYGYLIFVLLVGIGYLLPLICYFAWGFASRLCLYTPMRGYVQDICIGPHLTQTPIEDPWFIGFWQNEDDLPEERPESWIDHIMTAPALLQDANLFLDKAIRKTKQLPPGGLLAKDIVGDIERAQITVQILESTFTSFTRTLCEGMDHHNSHLRAFVIAIARALTVSKHEPLSNVETFLMPARFVLRFMNQYLGWSRLPEPKVYTIQVQREVMYQTQKFRRESVRALAEIDGSFARIAQGTTAVASSLEQTSDAIHRLRDRLRRTRDETQDLAFWERWAPNSMITPAMAAKRQSWQTLDKLGAYLKLTDELLGELSQALPEYRAYRKKLQSALADLSAAFDSVSSIDFSSLGELVLPANLYSYTARPPDFFWQKLSYLNSSRSNQGQDEYDTLQNLPPGFNRYTYDLLKMNGADVREVREHIGRVCRSVKISGLPNGSLSFICKIWTYSRTVSRLNDGVLDGVQISWVRMRFEAVDRYRKVTDGLEMGLWRTYKKAAKGANAINVDLEES